MKRLHLVDLSKKRCVLCGKNLSTMNLSGEDKREIREVYCDSKMTYDKAKANYETCN